MRVRGEGGQRPVGHSGILGSEVTVVAEKPTWPGRCRSWDNSWVLLGLLSFLLAVGVNTCDIITLYISAIKALRVLDPSMVILEVACEPIRRYLR